MALPAGITFTPNLSRSSWPPRAVLPLVLAAPMRGLGHEARVAIDGSRWCAYCDITVDPNGRATQCTPCRRFRDRLRHGPAAHTFASVPTELIAGLLVAAHEANYAALRDIGKQALNGHPAHQRDKGLNQKLADLFAITLLLQEYLETQGTFTADYLKDSMRRPLCWRPPTSQFFRNVQNP